MLRTIVLLIALVSDGAVSAAVDLKKTQADVTALKTACVSFIQPISAALEHTNFPVKQGFSMFKVPTWDMDKLKLGDPTIMGWSKTDELQNKKISVRVELESIPNNDTSETCGPKRVLLTRAFVTDGVEEQTLLGGQAFSFLQQVR